jgi:chromosome segregation ATPase
MTLEEAQAEILRLNEELTTVKNERDSYSTKVNEQADELEKVRNLNQQYFLKLSAQYVPNTDTDEDDADEPTCEDFAKSLTI